MSDQGLNARLGLDSTEFDRGLKGAEANLKKFGTQVNSVRPNLIGLSQALRDSGNFAISAQTGFLAISNNLPSVIDDFTRYRQQLTAASGTTATFAQTLKGFAGSLAGPAGISIAISVAATAIPILIGKFLQAENATKKLIKESFNFSEALKEGARSVATEATNVTKLVAVLNSEVVSRRQKIAALNELKKINPGIFGGLKEEDKLITKVNESYQKYIATLRERVEVAKLEKELNDLISKQLERQQDKGLADRLKKVTAQIEKQGFGVTVTPEIKQRITDQDLLDKGIEKRIQEVFQRLTELGDKIKVTGGDKTVKAKNPLGIAFEIATVELEKGQPALQEALEKLRKETIANTNPAINVPLNITVPQSTFDALKKFGETEYFKKLKEDTDSVIKQFDQFLTPVINTAFEALGNGTSIFKAIGQSLKALVVQLGITVAKSAILAAILNSIGGLGTGTGAVKGFGNIFKSLLGFGQTAAPNFAGVGGGGLAVTVGGQFNVRGTDLVAVVNQGNQRIGRVG